jgi:hypothetical protein
MPRPNSKPPSPHVSHSPKSSPVADFEQAKNAMETFFAWKAMKTSRDTTKAKIMDAYEIVVAEMWTFDDLKKMQDLTSAIYKLAISKGIPGGLARGFRTDITTFKPQWRSSENLVALRNII